MTEFQSVPVGSIPDLDINTFKIDGPPSVYYIPNFISEREEEHLINKINEAPLPRWTQLSNRRLQNWGGDPHPKGMIAEPLPDWLKKYTDLIGSIQGLFVDHKPNHVLVNEYLPGQGIMPHLDGPLFYSTITTISVGSHTVLNFYRPLEPSVGNGEGSGLSSLTQTNSSSWSDRLEFSLFAAPRSLLILRDKAYDYFLHGIEEIQEDVITDKMINSNIHNLTTGDTLERATRVSLTIRHVPKTTKPMLLFGKRR